MDISKVIGVCFSPTGSTREVVKLVMDASCKERKLIDITNYNDILNNKEYKEDEVIIVGFPVYSGRAPQILISKLKGIKGNGTPCIIIGTYGNRHYDDAILEMRNTLQDQGFNIVMAVAVVTEHSIVRSIATDRPDTKDITKIKEIASDIFDKLQSIKEIRDIEISGNENYREIKKLPFKPHVTKKCTNCGICINKCPVNAISKENPKKIKKDLCINCMRCIDICPQKARKLHKYESFLAKQSLKDKCKEYREIEVWI